MNPYVNVSSSGFWRPAVADRNMFDISGLWEPKFSVRPNMKVSTYGSCFAQHIGRALASRGYNWFITETAPFGASDETVKNFNYGVFSCRTGNIYTPTLLLQWLRWAFKLDPVPDEIWQIRDRYYDPFRPNIEPNGFSSKEEVIISRQATLDAFKRSVVESDIFVFTLGLTEHWINSSGYEYPMCPGTVAGTFDENVHLFRNLSFDQARHALVAAIKLMLDYNKRLKFILTVSPVPLTATKSGKHVLVATMQSKSILRAVAGQLSDNRGNIDYFPSYEIINSPVFRGTFFEPNQRSVNKNGVALVMDHFFSEQKERFGTIPSSKVSQKTNANNDIVCEEELLESFGEQK